jgi:calcium-translocating P-type ATPase
MLDITSHGLSKEELEANIQKYGLNKLPKKATKTLFQIYIEQHKNPIIYILLFASVTAFFIHEYSDAFFILGVLVLNSIIGTTQEYKAEVKAQSLEESFKTTVTVIRDSKPILISSEELTVGDFVLLESGTKVPADIVLDTTQELLVDESLLTGESIEVKKDANSAKHNEVFAGTIVTKGRGSGVVKEIGLQSQIGKIATLLAESSKGKAPLEIRIKKLSLTIAKAILIVVCLLFVIGYFRDIEFYELLFFSIALMVSAIPEGLPVAITIALSSASYAMSKRGVIIRKLSAIEALGSCTLIASDKTGTLTKNELSVDRFVPFKKEINNLDDSSHIVKIGSLLCNEMTYETSENGLKFIGDQVDIALAKHVLSPDETFLLTAQEYKKVDDIPYESINRYSAVMVHKDNEQYEFIKGSPETILEFCNITQEDKNEILQEVYNFANDGFRNIAIAYKKEPIENAPSQNITLNNFKYLGFMAIIDPIREESYEAVKKAQEAGIEVVMITGDHPNTAFYIARLLGICQSLDEVMDCDAISLWKQNGSNPEALKDIKVYARVNPEQKKDIVCALQDLGHFVAVTGDGVNDAPALKHSNIGIAMGKGGTDIAKSTGDIILTDDNFKSIINGLEEGRRAYDNIRKVIYLLISTGFAEIVLIVLVFITNLPLPLLPVQILWLNLATNGLEDVLLALEKSEKDILKRKPRKPSERIFNPIMIKRVITGGMYMALTAFIIFYFLLQNGYSEYSARNITLLLMVLFENVHVFNARTEMNYLYKMEYKSSALLILWVIFTQVAHIGCMHFPFTQNLLSLEPVSISMWFMLLTVAIGLVVVMEIEKFIRKRGVRTSSFS